MHKIQISLSIVFTLLLPVSLALAFTDVYSSNQHYDAIKFLQEEGVVEGYSDGTYRSDSNINRAEFLKILIGSRDVGQITGRDCFPDVGNEWFAGYICFAKMSGIVDGYPDGYFRPENNINLAEALKIIVETYGVELLHDTSTGLDWYVPYFWAMKDPGYLSSVSEEIGHKISRGEMAQLIYNIVNSSDTVIDTSTPLESPAPVQAEAQSTFFSNDTDFDAIMTGTPYDMNGFNPTPGNGDKNTFGYKIYSALKMIGYDTFTGRSDPHIFAFNRFQIDHGFGESDLLSSEVLSRLDIELSSQEDFDASMATYFPLHGSMVPRHPNDYSADHSSMLFASPIRVLPGYLQLTTLDQWIGCTIFPQCAGRVINVSSIAPTPFTDEVTVFTGADFIDSFIPEESSNGILWSDSATMQVILHEYAHYLDGVQQPTYEDKKMGIIDTREFYDISFEGVAGKTLEEIRGGGNCFDRRTNDDYDFITSYAMSHGVNHPEGCGIDRYTLAEDFAESFSAYVVSGISFRQAAAKNSTINDKYQWLRNNVFQGIQYDTDLTWENASGCTDDYLGNPNATPGYMKCDSSYVWDGELGEL